MRTATFLGLLFINYAIDKAVLNEVSYMYIVGLFIIITLTADVIDVIKKIDK